MHELVEDGLVEMGPSPEPRGFDWRLIERGVQVGDTFTRLWLGEADE